MSWLSGEAAAEIYAMRIAIETVVQRLTRSDIIRARSVLKIIDCETDKALWGDLNWEFHATLCQAARMSRLLHTLHNNVTRYLIIYLDRLLASDKSQQEHWDLLAACRRKDIPGAVAILKKHLHQASVNLVLHLNA